MWYLSNVLLEPISKMSFGPISLWVPRFKSSTTNRLLPVYDPQKYNKIDGESSNAGKLGLAARVPAKPLGEDGILNQNPIFEMGSS
jgi:hypothetical protein